MLIGSSKAKTSTRSRKAITSSSYRRFTAVEHDIIAKGSQPFAMKKVL
jgi:hypothetical protein